MTSRQTARTIALVASAVALAVPATASATGSGGTTQPGQARTCAHRFDQAQRADMESFRDFDFKTFAAGHDEGTVTIVADGRVRIGKAAVLAAAKPRFEAKNSVWSWTEITRKVDGCRTAFIVYNTKYALPHLDYWFTAVTSVTYEYKGGRWLSIMDQGTLLEEHVGNA
ncbi:hypothetical protein [Luteipulveratus mongoliensis]|uniref:Nuclear transport factor 2 family protein n=1 Tax=Luteipulveratus mongoliensis TaxID=571913 RepID=A0A0K1JEU4_9MICO|nr:hypothetical protein [Luteipulveratus mongoliensis]AKU15216.1 hypothetical protein VV02_03970 [Luteipulveratus mongoliensis]